MKMATLTMGLMTLLHRQSTSPSDRDRVALHRDPTYNYIYSYIIMGLKQRRE
jgi:hypothetical protein